MKQTQASVIVRVKSSGPNWSFTVRDLKTGRQCEFASWEALRSYLESLTKGDLK